jgi:chromosome segregation ATPase
MTSAMENLMTGKLTVTLVALGCVAAGCASGPKPYETQITRAETTIDQAQSSTATRLAPDPINTAQDKLAAAKIAADEGNETAALQLAEEAELDANIAMARANKAEAESALREVQDGIDTLREELSQDTYAPGVSQ